jgi:3' terminal RNA ribose 2'-O-methyltransferase Hen1
LLEKHPAKHQTFSLAFGEAHVFYPEATDARCTAALLLGLDPIGLVRRPNRARALEAYVNDRPYVASSYFSVAIAQVLGSALAGRSRNRAELAALPIPLEARLSAVRCRGGEELVRRLFAPLGYAIELEPHALDPAFPEWGMSQYFSLTLRGNVRVAELLSHLYLLVPVLDSDKHYFVGEDEVEKLLQKGEPWLGTHPERELIVNRYLKHKRSLTRDALSRLSTEDDTDDDENEIDHAEVEPTPTLNEQRIAQVIDVLREAHAQTVLDLGCGEGNLLRALLRERDPAFSRIVGVDVSPLALARAARHLRLDDMPDAQRARIDLFQGSLGYRDKRFAGFDAACAIEVIEHLDPSRLPAFERVVFESARPHTVIVTTPNVEYNALFPSLPAGTLRHRDHRFEWTRAELESWSTEVAARFGYAVRLLPVGPVDTHVGAPTQMAVFTR